MQAGCRGGRAWQGCRQGVEGGEGMARVERGRVGAGRGSEGMERVHVWEPAQRERLGPEHVPRSTASSSSPCSAGRAQGSTACRTGEGDELEAKDTGTKDTYHHHTHKPPSTHLSTTPHHITAAPQHTRKQAGRQAGSTSACITPPHTNLPPTDPNPLPPALPPPLTWV